MLLDLIHISCHCHAEPNPVYCIYVTNNKMYLVWHSSDLATTRCMNTESRILQVRLFTKNFVLILWLDLVEIYYLYENSVQIRNKFWGGQKVKNIHYSESD